MSRLKIPFAQSGLEHMDGVEKMLDNRPGLKAIDLLFGLSLDLIRFT